MTYYYDNDDKQIKEGNFETIATSRITGNSFKVEFEYDEDDCDVKAIIKGKYYTAAQLAASNYDFT